MDVLFSRFEGDSPVLQTIGKWAYQISANRELIKMYIHLILAAVFPIYIGAHASLRRPPSAAIPKKKTKDEDGEEEEEIKIEGMTPSDAIMFPVLAGITLGGLYALIKWMDDPKLLNKILNVYFSVLGVFGVGKLAADCLHVYTTFVFPNVWSTATETYYIDQMLSQQVTGFVNKARVQVHRRFLEDKTNPFPGWLSGVQFSPAVNKFLWKLRSEFKSHMIFKAHFRGIFTVKSKVRLNDVFGFFIGVGVIALYNMNDAKPWWLTNIMGFGFCYGTLQLMSPTTFWTGTLILSSLFVYDIVMVFYTPLMITVATSLEVPIKLVFPGPKRGSMLGLGDVVLPGIMMALALRFDLYLHYLRKQRTTSKPTIPPRAIEPDTIVRAKYQDATGLWGERYWTRKAKQGEETAADGARFPKTYFKASLVGYVSALLVTLVVMNVFNHAQPALLYLVPGVLSALWGTAFARNEVALMWDYSEDGEWGLEPEEKGKGGEEEKGDGSKKIEKKSGDEVVVAHAGGKRVEKEKKKDDEYEHHVFMFSLESPRVDMGAQKALF
ncbi:hypothetical protein WAI453_002257 [Rhynchosporium graminicola]|uniref:Related to Minor histocompatibility antigen H13 n=1 Tax=Rhynchosporium graminicola TaxID=2792576 RepID=A0A1E1LC55_9HELO|nr:related to Minor histocompatibility antigen H13 [Rhynchosporium commune]